MPRNEVRKIVIRLSNFGIGKVLAADYYDEVNEWFDQEIPQDILAEIDEVMEHYVVNAKQALQKHYPNAVLNIEEFSEDSIVEVDPPEALNDVEEFINEAKSDWRWQALMQ